jgi:hypothetical protein
MTLNLKQIMKNLFIESHEDVFSKITEKEFKQFTSPVIIPIFNVENRYDKFTQKNKLNFKKIVYTHKKSIIKLSSYKIVQNVLKTQIRKKSKFYDKQLVTDFDNVVTKLILNFLVELLNNLKYQEFNHKKFDALFLKFSNHIENELFSVFCFITLRNFSSKKTTFTLPDNQIFRLRDSDEFLSICNIDENVKSIPRIHPNFQNITHVVGTNISKTSIDVKKIQQRLEPFLFALKIYHGGNVQFGGVYYRESDNWRVKSPICILPEPILSKSTTNYFLEDSSYSDNSFKQFLKLFLTINFSKGKYSFLNRSIERFSRSLENQNKLDRIVDFITCLESLYSSKELQLSFRFAMRVAIVFGQTPHEKLMLQQFILKIYDLRSKIVHGDTIPKISIDGKTIDLDSVLNYLEMTSRISIKIFLELLQHFEDKNGIHKFIDDSLYEPNKPKILSNALKKVKFDKINLI